MTNLQIPISSMFEMSDKDAEVIMVEVAALTKKHKTMPGMVKELTTKYGEDAVLAGMIMQKAIDFNDRAVRCDESAESFKDPTFILGDALEISVDEATKICKEVGEFALGGPKWKSVFASVGKKFGERAVYAGAFMLYLHTKAEGEPKKKYDYGHG